ncbi:uncharacterized protein PG998_007021 [Apiospora kogelbergensis]|uniref:uncharacterized protein n=1 Tax=Apiospora kogelbergensis TaxID=1337665 RepID=UPI00312E1485
MASTSASTFSSSVTASAPPAAGQHQQAAGFHAMPPPPPPPQQQQTFHLTPEMEEGIKAALAATNPDPASRSRKEKKNRSAWNLAKYFLRYTILLVSVGIVVAEFIIAMTQTANLDTALGVVWVRTPFFTTFPLPLSTR